MPEYMTDEERAEESKEEKEEERRRRREPSVEELLACPTWGCTGGPEVWRTGARTEGGEIWAVGCPVCNGWISYMLIRDGDDPYGKGTEVWLSWRKGEE